MAKIIVLTPVKNEKWILDRFLSVTSKFADVIIVADQSSTDGSLDVYNKYEKVHLIKNEQQEYDEASRQLLLLETARKLFPDEKRILLALDSDEIMAADAMDKRGWQTMLEAEPGTILYFEKPDLYQTPFNVLRYEFLWPIGYVDDGVEHKPSRLHSIRIPRPDYAAKLYLNEIKVMHYALTRMDGQDAKMMLYSMLENIHQTKSTLVRRYTYRVGFNYAGKNIVQATPQTWFERWEQEGIDMKSISSVSRFWQNDEALSLFAKHGYKKFWYDNIWNYNWEQLAKPLNQSIKRPPAYIAVTMKLADKVYVWLRRLKSSFR